jgi:hypothetical protein
MGSLAPDFEYLFRLAPRGDYGHTIAGIFAFCLPVAMAAWMVWRWFMKPAFLGLLPQGIRAEIGVTDARLGGRNFGWAIVATLLGTLTHLAWDAFTHHDGWAVLALPALREQAVPSVGTNLRWYQLLQHGSTFVGLVVVVLWAINAWLRFPAQARRFAAGEASHAARVLLTLLAVSAAAAILNATRVWGNGTAPVLGFAAVGAMTGLVLAALGLATMARLGGGAK